MNHASRAPSAPRKPSGLAAFRGAHQGETILVCGCGQSLSDLREPQRFTTIGVNDVGRLFDPTYLVVVNPRSQFKKDRFRYIEGSKARALFTQLDLGPVEPAVVRFRLGKYGGTDLTATDALHYTQNSPYVAVCLAAYLGARRIGLIGVDLTDHHFFAQTGRHSLAGRLREIDCQYGRLADALQARGVELVNLSAVSRLTSLPRVRIEEDESWTHLVSGPVTVATPNCTSVAQPKESSMRIAIERRSTGVVGQWLEALAASAMKLGHMVVRDPRATAQDPRVLSIVWNGRAHRSSGPTLYCEHGWFPRSAYQVSPAGINAGSHLAPFAWDGTPLTPEEDAALDAHIAGIKAASFSGYYQYMQADMEVPEGLPREFLLVPLQIESDTNLIRHAPGHLRTMQALVDHVAKLEPPWPVIFKQHPVDGRRGNRHLQLRMRRSQDLVWAHSRGNIHQMLKSGACRGILTINSNVAHDGLLWDVPAVVLGRNVWPSSGSRSPFLTEIPRDWSALRESVAAPASVACRRAYAYFLMNNQWTLEDARDPRKVATLLAAARARRPTAVPDRQARRIAPTILRRPAINVVAENRGWLFEAWKRAFAAASCPGFDIVPSNRPLRPAAAWIFIRAREAAATPDPSRTLVQLHDLFDEGAYRRGGSRSGVARCAGLALTHPGQQGVLAANGIDLDQRRWIIQPVGWSATTASRSTNEALPTVAWIGRPAIHAGVDVARLDWFVDAAARLRGRARVVLIGERLDRAAAALRRAGVTCQVDGLNRHPPLQTAAWIGRFDCAVICGGADSGPWPLFDAIHAGVPVVAAPVGWAGQLLADGVCGRLAENPAAIGEAIAEVLSRRQEWRDNGPLMRERVTNFSLKSWIERNLALARDLAERREVHEVA